MTIATHQDGTGARIVAGHLDQLQETLLALTFIAERRDEERKRDLIKLRRVLAERLAALRNAALADGSSIGQSARCDEFCSRFARMRSVVALHQATWSAVRLDEANEEYRASATNVSRTLSDFITWTRSLLPKTDYDLR